MTPPDHKKRGVGGRTGQLLTSDRMLTADKRNNSTQIHLGAMTLLGLPTETWPSQGSLIAPQFHLSMGGCLIKAASVEYQFQLTLQLQYLQHPSDHIELWDRRGLMASPGECWLILALFF